MTQEYPIAPEVYDAWYQTVRGSWIGQQEFSALLKLFSPVAGQTLLDIGSGSGNFSRRFSQLGLNVTGYDASSEMNEYANANSRGINYIQGDALSLPFADNSVDYCSAITSLCFVSKPEQALAEMWRVSRKAVLLGLLNRNSLLYYMKRNSKGYQGARWDKFNDVTQWSNHLKPAANINYRSAIWLPSGGIFSRTIESIAPKQYPYAGFLAVVLEKHQD